jgi:hypothetical protein
MFDSVSSHWGGILEVLIGKNQKIINWFIRQRNVGGAYLVLDYFEKCHRWIGGFEVACCLTILWKTKVLPFLEAKLYVSWVYDYLQLEEKGETAFAVGVDSHHYTQTCYVLVVQEPKIPWWWWRWQWWRRRRRRKRKKKNEKRKVRVKAQAGWIISMK